MGRDGECEVGGGMVNGWVLVRCWWLVGMCVDGGWLGVWRWWGEWANAWSARWWAGGRAGEWTVDG